jgi:hypothetical protein
MQWCAAGRESDGARAGTCYSLVRMTYCQIIDRQGRGRLDQRTSPSERSTVKAEIRGKNCRKIIFSKVSFRTRMYY